MIHVGLFDDVNNPDNSRRFGVGVVEEGLVTNLHGSHVILGRVIPDSVPVRGGVNSKLLVASASTDFLLELSEESLLSVFLLFTLLGILEDIDLLFRMEITLVNCFKQVKLKILLIFLNINLLSDYNKEN